MLVLFGLKETQSFLFLHQHNLSRRARFVHTIAVVDNRVLDNNILRAIYVPILKIISLCRKII